jgi:predicted DNA-binding helix-hairpin-helix protein
VTARALSNRNSGTVDGQNGAVSFYLRLAISLTITDHASCSGHYQFKGYIHLKILPGASYSCVEEACRIATRVSVNMEAPTAAHLARLSMKKDIHSGILERMNWVKRLTEKNPWLAPGGQTTQFVVGAAGETDRDLLVRTDSLYNEIGLKRVYFSAFRPVPDSRLENKPRHRHLGT